MRTKCERERRQNDSNTDYTDRRTERDAEEGRVLLPDVQGQAGSAAVSTEMGGYPGTKGGTGEVYCEVRQERVSQKRPKMNQKTRN